MPIFTVVDDPDNPLPMQHPAITLVDADGGPYNPATSIPDGTYAGVAQGAQAAQPFLAKIVQGADATALILGDSTGVTTARWVYLWAVTLGARYLTHSVDYYAWDDATSVYLAPTRIQTGSGAGVIRIYNASDSGSRTTYPLAPNFATQVVATNPDVVMVSHGHNEARYGTADGEDFMERMLALTERVTSVLPTVGIILVAQNPASADTDQTGRAQAVHQIAAMRGYDVVNVWQAFVNTGDAAGLTSDGVHPTSAGSTIWAAEVDKAFRYALGVAPRPRQPSSLLAPGEHIFANSNFADFTAALPDSWTGVNVTASKDLTNYKSANGYGVKLVHAGAGSAYIYQDSPVINFVKGEWVTCTAIMRQPSGATALARVNLQTFGTGAQSRTSSNYLEDVGDWKPTVNSIFVPAGATILRCTIYARVGSTGSGDVTIDRLVFTRGRLPAGAVGAAGPRGLTGAAGSPAGVFARKTSDSALVDNTIADDAELVCALLANTTYLVEGFLIYDQTGATTGDLKVAFTVPAGATIWVAPVALSSAASTTTNSVDVSATQTGNMVFGAVSSTKAVGRIRGIVRTAGTAGNLQLRRAQNVTAGANPTNLYADSFLLATVAA